MTKGQIVTFCIIARCCFAAYAARVGAMGIIGDRSFEEERSNLILINSYLKTIQCYDPDATSNCLTSDDIFILIGRVSEMLGLCGDSLSLEESNSDCCNIINGATIVN